MQTKHTHTKTEALLQHYLLHIFYFYTTPDNNKIPGKVGGRTGTRERGEIARGRNISVDFRPCPFDTKSKKQLKHTYYIQSCVRKQWDGKRYFFFICDLYSQKRLKLEISKLGNIIVRKQRKKMHSNQKSKPIGRSPRWCGAGGLTKLKTSIIIILLILHECHGFESEQSFHFSRQLLYY